MTGVFSATGTISLVLTNSPSVCGIAILGIFLAIGFAISNSISGSLTGELSANNVHYLFGEETHGNIEALLLFCIL